MIPSNIYPSVVEFASNGAFSHVSAVLVPPLPVRTPDHPGPQGHVPDLLSDLLPLSPEDGLCLPGSLADVVTDSSDSAVEFEPRQGEVVGLSTGILPCLLDPHVPPALPLLPRGEGPGGSGSRFIQRGVIRVSVEGGPIVAIFGDLQQPVAKSRPPVSPSMPQSVAGRQDPDSQVNCEPSFPVIVRVAVEGRGVPGKDVLHSPVWETLPLRTGDYD